MEDNANRTFEDKLEDLMLDDLFNHDIFRNHLLILDADKYDKRRVLNNVLLKTNWKKFDEVKSEIENKYDYVYITNSKIGKKELFELFYKFNGKIFIFDIEEVLKKQSLINILEGAVCSSPDSGTKWSIRLEGRKEFKFNGTVILISSQEKDKFLKTSKYQYLTRDMIIL